MTKNSAARIVDNLGNFVLNSMALRPSLWLDTVRAVPALGIKLEPKLEHASNMLDVLNVVIDGWGTLAKRSKISMDDPFQVKIERPDGFELRVKHDDVLARFYYLQNIQEHGRRQGVLEFQCEPKAVTELLDEVKKIVEEACSAMWARSKRRVQRIGIVVAGSFDEESPPPGFSELLRHFAYPWEYSPSGIQAKITVDVAKKPSYIERCHHFVTTESEEKGVIRFSLDWQREFSELKDFTMQSLSIALNDSVSEAVKYFGKFGMGDLRYVHERD